MLFEFVSKLIVSIHTIHKYGFTSVNANNEWATMVVITETNTQKTLRPVLSITKPKNGLAAADMIYTKEVTKFASCGSKLYLFIKNTLRTRN